MASIERRERRDGKVRWTVRVFMGRDPTTGKRKYVVKTFDRKKDADHEARRLERMKDQGGLTEPSKEPLSDYLVEWLDAKEGEVRARTIHDYRGILRRYIQEPPDGAPPLGTIQLHRLTPHAFEALYTWLWKEKELAPRTLQYLHSILRQALGDAVNKGALARNPTDHVKRPTRAYDNGNGDEGQGEDEGVNAMSEEEAGKFLEEAREDRYFALWALLLMGGLRPGEALGLKWPDVDMDEGRVHVQRSLTRTGVRKVCDCGHGREDHGDDGRGACEHDECDGCERYRGGSGWKLLPPKTKRARRVVPLPAVALGALREWRAKVAEERLLLGAEYADDGPGLVFVNEFGRALDQGNLASRNFRRIMAKAGLGEWYVFERGSWVREEDAEAPEEALRRRFRPAFRMYDLRHTCATLLLKKGVAAKIVSERLGHANITLTLDTYSHVLPDMQEGAVEALDAVFGAGG